jgi:hypothetical protein
MSEYKPQHGDLVWDTQAKQYAVCVKMNSGAVGYLALTPISAVIYGVGEHDRFTRVKYKAIQSIAEHLQCPE